VLWFDPQREWEGLLPYLQPHLPLLTFEVSQLHLRYQLVNRPPDQWFVVCSPMRPDGAGTCDPFSTRPGSLRHGRNLSACRELTRLNRPGIIGFYMHNTTILVALCLRECQGANEANTKWLHSPA
jgi:hypothetical protein